jgi:hypothetical protein
VLVNYNFPKNKGDIKNILRKKLKEFLLRNVDKLIKNYKQFLNDKVKLLNLELEKEKKIFDELMSEYYNIYVYTGNDLLDYIQNIQNKIKQYKDTLLKDQWRKILNKIYWLLEVKKIDLLIEKL